MKDCDYLKKNKFLIGLMWIMLCGVFVGVLSYCNLPKDSLDTLSILERGFVSDRTNCSVFEIIIQSMTTSTLILTGLYLLGFSCIAQPVEVLAIFLRGLGLGTTLAYIYSLNGSKGFLIILLLIVPFATVSSFAMIIGAREAIQMSNILVSYMLSDGNTSGKREVFKLYSVKFLVLEAIIAVSAALDGLSTFLFAGLLL